MARSARSRLERLHLGRTDEPEPALLEEAEPQPVVPEGVAREGHGPREQLRLRPDHARLLSHCYERTQPPDLLPLVHQRLRRLLEHAGLPLAQAEVVGQVGSEPGDGRVVVGSPVHRDDERLQRGPVLLARAAGSARARST